tara:strand:- start:260 stop:1111 length:852 start_codon:yes stop_codon:yes gene_type:complete
MNTSIVKTIYSELDKLNDGPINLSEEDIERTGEALKDALRHWSTPKPSSEFSVRMSNLGKPLRQIWFDSRKQTQASRITPQTFIKFLYGHLMEEIVLMLVRMTGTEVTDEQKEVELKGIKGHIDCKINGEVVDIKTASNFAFKKFADGTLHDNDPFGYLMQLSAYEAAEESSNGGFLAVNKESGELAYYDPGELVKPNPSIKIDNILQILKEDSPPELCYQPVPEGKQGNMKLVPTCVYCSHKKECWSDVNGGQGLRAFRYSNGVRYLTRVASLPKVDEIPLL